MLQKYHTSIQGWDSYTRLTLRDSYTRLTLRDSYTRLIVESFSQVLLVSESGTNQEHGTNRYRIMKPERIGTESGTNQENRTNRYRIRNESGKQNESGTNQKNGTNQEPKQLSAQTPPTVEIKSDPYSGK